MNPGNCSPDVTSVLSYTLTNDMFGSKDHSFGYCLEADEELSTGLSGSSSSLARNGSCLVALEDEVAGIEADATEDEVAGIEADATEDEVAGIEADATEDEVAGIEADATEDEVAGIEADATEDEVILEKTFKEENKDEKQKVVLDGEVENDEKELEEIKNSSCEGEIVEEEDVMKNSGESEMEEEEDLECETKEERMSGTEGILNTEGMETECEATIISWDDIELTEVKVQGEEDVVDEAVDRGAQERGAGQAKTLEGGIEEEGAGKGVVEEGGVREEGGALEGGALEGGALEGGALEGGIEEGGIEEGGVRVEGGALEGGAGKGVVEDGGVREEGGTLKGVVEEEEGVAEEGGVEDDGVKEEGKIENGELEKGGAEEGIAEKGGEVEAVVGEEGVQEGGAEEGVKEECKAQKGGGAEKEGIESGIAKEGGAEEVVTEEGGVEEGLVEGGAKEKETKSDHEAETAKFDSSNPSSEDKSIGCSAIRDVNIESVHHNQIEPSHIEYASNERFFDGKHGTEDGEWFERIENMVEVQAASGLELERECSSSNIIKERNDYPADFEADIKDADTAEEKIENEENLAKIDQPRIQDNGIVDVEVEENDIELTNGLQSPTDETSNLMLNEEVWSRSSEVNRTKDEYEEGSAGIDEASPDISVEATESMEKAEKSPFSHLTIHSEESDVEKESELATLSSKNSSSQESLKENSPSSINQLVEDIKDTEVHTVIVKFDPEGNSEKWPTVLVPDDPVPHHSESEGVVYSKQYTGES